MNCLHLAANYGHLKLCKTLIDKHRVVVDMADCYGCAAIHYAVKSGSYDMIKYFVENGTDVYLKTNTGMNCLHIAALYGHVNLCRMLIEIYKIDMHASDMEGWTALHFSAKNGSCELINFFAVILNDINVETNDGCNCLHIAALYGHMTLCNTLIDKYKFDMHATDNEGLTALHYSVKNGSIELFEFFGDMLTDIAIKDYGDWNCLHIAALHGHLNLCKTLIYKYKFDVHMDDIDGWTGLHHSAKNGSYELVNFFLDMGSDINLKDCDGWNCLHIAARYGHFNLCKKLVDEHHLGVDMADNDGWTMLHHSVVSGSNEIVKFCIDKGMDVYLKTNDGKDCLHIALLYGSLNVCRTFLDQYDFEMHNSDNEGWTKLHCSAKSGCLSMFLEILNKGCELYCKTKKMENVLHLAALNGHYDICKFVLEYFTKDYRYNNSRNEYVLNGKYYRSQIFYKYSTIFLHAMNVDGNTYLHLAAEENHTRICELLLEYDTEIITVLNKNDESARDIAEYKQHKNVSNALKAEYDREGTIYFEKYHLLKKFTNFELCFTLSSLKHCKKNLIFKKTSCILA